MRYSIRRFLIGSGVAIGLMVLLTLGLAKFLDPNSHKSEIETSVKQATGLTLQIQDKITFGFLPHFYVALKNPRLLKEGHELFSANKIYLSARLLPLLLHHQIVVTEINLRAPKLLIETDAKGHSSLDAGKTKGTGATVPNNWSVRSVQVKDGDFSFLNSVTGEKVTLNGITLQIRDISSSRFDDIKKALQFNGHLSAQSLGWGSRKITQLNLDFRFNRGLMDLPSTQAAVFDGTLKGSGSLDLRSQAPQIKLTELFSGIDLAQAGAGKPGTLKGIADATIQLQAFGSDAKSILRNATGAVAIQGRGIGVSEANVDAKARSISIRAEKSAHSSLWRAGRLRVNEGEFDLRNQKGERSMHLAGVHLEFQDFTLNSLTPNTVVGELLKSLSFRGSLAVRQFNLGDREINNLNSNLRGDHGLIDLNSTSLSAFGGTTEGNLTIDLRGTPPTFALVQNARGIGLDQSIPSLKNKVAGRVDAKLHLNWTGTSSDALIRSMTGSVAILGKDITVTGVDIDTLAGELKAAEAMNLVTLGTSALSGAAQAAVPGSSSTKSVIQTLVSDWKISRGIAQTQDVAFSTDQHTLAFQGQLDLIKKVYQNFFIATVDSKGCAAHKVQIAGPLDQPRPTGETVAGVVSRAIKGTPGSIASDITGIFDRNKKACDQFYSGSALQTG